GVAALASGIAGRLADRLGRKRVLITGLSLLALGFSGAGASPAPIFFFACLALTGVGYGFTAPSLYAIMSDLLPHRRGFGASLISVTYGIGGAVGAVLASRIAAIWGWRAAVVTVGGIAAADMLSQLYFVRDIQRQRSAARAGDFQSAFSRSLVLLAAMECIGGSVFWSCAAWTPTALRGAKLLTLQETGWVMSLLSIANMAGSFSLGSLSDRLGRKLVIMTSAVPSAIAAFFVFYWLESALAIGAGIFIFGVLKASVPALVVALAQETAPPASAGTAAGIIMALHYTSGVIAPLLAGKLIAASGDILLAMVLVSSVPLIFYAALAAAVRERAVG